MSGNNEIILKYVKLTENAFPPSKISLLAPGYDLKSAYDIIVRAYYGQLVNSDLQIQFPRGWYGRIAPPSGVAWNHAIDVGAGIIDENYRGNVGVVLFNHSDHNFEVERGDRVAQIICERIYHPTLIELKKVNNKRKDSDGDRELKKNTKFKRGVGGSDSTKIKIKTSYVLS